jgi:hypothetical protein
MDLCFRLRQACLLAVSPGKCFLDISGIGSVKTHCGDRCDYAGKDYAYATVHTIVYQRFPTPAAAT